MNRKLWIGLAMILATYTELLIPRDWALTHHFLAGFPLSAAVGFFAFGAIFVGEGLCERFGGVSLIGLARGGGARRFVRFFLVAAIVGLTLEIFAQWLGKLWYYAYYPTWFYWPALVPSFVLYWVMITETYMGAKAVLDYFTRRSRLGRLGREQHKYFGFEPYFYTIAGMAGAGLFVFGTLRALFDYFATGGFSFNALTLSNFAPPLSFIIMACFGIWLMSEAVQYARQAPSLLNSLFHGYLVPVAAIIVASAVTSIVWESQNAMVDYWVYAHWPWADLRLFDVQVSVLLTWPIHYLVYLALPVAIIPAWGAVFFRRPKGEGDK